MAAPSSPPIVSLGTRPSRHGRTPVSLGRGERPVVAKAADGSAIERYAVRTPHESFLGDIEALPLWAGQGVARIDRVQTARAIFDDLLSETTTCLARLGST
jgi:nitronate monooxygenase